MPVNRIRSSDHRQSEAGEIRNERLINPPHKVSVGLAYGVIKRPGFILIKESIFITDPWGIVIHADHNSFDSVFGGHPAPVDQTLHILFAGDIEMRFIIRGNIYMQKQHKTHKIQRAHFLHSGE